MSSDEQYGDKLYYHTSSGERLLPAEMKDIHLKNAKAKLELNEEFDCPIYNVICEELKKRGLK